VIRGTKECPRQHTLSYCQQYNKSDHNTLWDTKTKSETATQVHSQFDISPLHVPFFCIIVTFGLQTIQFTQHQVTVLPDKESHTLQNTIHKTIWD